MRLLPAALTQRHAIPELPLHFQSRTTSIAPTKTYGADLVSL